MTSQALEKSGRVLVDTPETMNLLGLLMSGLLATNMQDEGIYRRASGLSGDVLVRAGEMAVTLRFGEGRITILLGDPGKARARVGGTMPALLGVVAEGKMVMPFLSGKIKIGGNPFFLLKILPLIRAK